MADDRPNQVCQICSCSKWFHCPSSPQLLELKEKIIDFLASWHITEFIDLAELDETERNTLIFILIEISTLF